MKFPIKGYITVTDKFKIPVMSAKMVPSMFLGVTEAKNDIKGTKKKEACTLPNTPSMKKLNQKLDTCICRFNCCVKIEKNTACIRPKKLLMSRHDRTSLFFMIQLHIRVEGMLTICVSTLKSATCILEIFATLRLNMY